MIEAPTLESIESILFETLGLPPEGGGTYTPEDFLSAPSLNDVKPKGPPGNTSKLVGLLFCRPTLKLGGEIVKDMSYFDLRSGRYVAFYCAGYGTSWPANRHADPKPVARIGETEWSFSEKAFVSLLNEVEAKTDWKYSGETDLILLAARGNQQRAQAALDFRDTITCHLEAMQKDGAITSAASFFEAIFSFGSKYDDSDNPLWDLSDELGLKQGKGFILELLLRLVPEAARKLYKSSRHLAVRDIAKG